MNAAETRKMLGAKSRAPQGRPGARSRSRRFAAVVAVVGAVVTIVVVPQMIGADRDPQDRPRPAGAQPGFVAPGPMLVGNRLRVDGLSFDVDPATASVGESLDGFVSTIGAQPLNSVSFYAADGAPVNTVGGVFGIALTADDSHMAAWIGPADVAAPDGARKLYVANTATGTVTAQLDIADYAMVMAVHGETVAISDDDQSWFYTSGGGLQPVPYVPDEFYIQDFDGQTVVVSDFDGALRVYARSGSALIGSSTGLISATLNDEGDMLSGVDSEGGAYTRPTHGHDPKVVQIGSGDEIYAVEWQDSDDVAARSPSNSDEGEGVTTQTCNADGTGCISATDPAAQALLPNNGLGQLFSAAS